MSFKARALKAHVVNARILIVSLLFLASACVIGSGKSEPQAEQLAPKAAVGAAPKKPEQGTAKGAAPVAVAKATAKPAAKAAKSEPKHLAKVPRYVDADILNVRSRPSYHAPVVAKLTRGTMFSVAVVGDWAEIGSGQYVLAKFLTKSQPH